MRDNDGRQLDYKNSRGGADEVIELVAVGLMLACELGSEARVAVLERRTEVDPTIKGRGDHRAQRRGAQPPGHAARTGRSAAAGGGPLPGVLARADPDAWPSPHPVRAGGLRQRDVQLAGISRGDSGSGARTSVKVRPGARCGSRSLKFVATVVSFDLDDEARASADARRFLRIAARSPFGHLGTVVPPADLRCDHKKVERAIMESFSPESDRPTVDVNMLCPRVMLMIIGNLHLQNSAATLGDGRRRGS